MIISAYTPLLRAGQLILLEKLLLAALDKTFILPPMSRQYPTASNE